MKIEVKQYKENEFNVYYYVAVNDDRISPTFVKLQDAVDWRDRYEKEAEGKLMPYFEEKDDAH